MNFHPLLIVYLAGCIAVGSIGALYISEAIDELRYCDWRGSKNERNNALIQTLIGVPLVVVTWPVSVPLIVYAKLARFYIRYVDDRISDLSEHEED